MLLCLLPLAGIPFVVGFWGKLYVFIAAWNAGLGWLVVVGMGVWPNPFVEATSEAARRFFAIIDASASYIH